MKAFITGANGQVGREILHTRPDNWEILAFTHAEIDITATSAVRNALQMHKPDLVINSAAYTDVDKAESEKENAYAVNSRGAANVAKAAKGSNTRLIHLSTDFVFDGSKYQPYLPSDTPNPINVYGASKLQGEQAVLTESMNKAAILRTEWVYSAHGNNFVKTMLRLMAERDEISVVSDQIGTPTWARDLAKAIWQVAEITAMQGIFHWTNDGIASWHDFALAIQEEALDIGLLDKKTSIKQIKTVDYPSPAKRPLYSVLDSTATWEALGYTPPHWRQSLRQMLAELKKLSTEC